MSIRTGVTSWQSVVNGQQRLSVSFCRTDRWRRYLHYNKKNTGTIVLLYTVAPPNKWLRKHGNKLSQTHGQSAHSCTRGVSEVDNHFLRRIEESTFLKEACWLGRRTDILDNLAWTRDLPQDLTLQRTLVYFAIFFVVVLEKVKFPCSLDRILNVNSLHLNVLAGAWVERDQHYARGR